MSFWVFLLCFGVAALSGMGVGGGGLLAVVLSLFTDLPALTVQGINLYFFLFAGAASLMIHLARRRMRFGVIALCVLLGLVGTFVGSMLAHRLGGGVTRRLFGGLLILTGAVTLLRSLRPLFPKKAARDSRNPSKVSEKGNNKQ